MEGSEGGRDLGGSDGARRWSLCCRTDSVGQTAKETRLAQERCVVGGEKDIFASLLLPPPCSCKESMQTVTFF